MKSPWAILILMILSISLAACGSNATPASSLPTVTPTSDPCAPENIKDEASKVHHLMREFDDASARASNTARAQLNDPISDLQSIRRDAEDLQVPGCLTRLKQVQLTYMNLVIGTLLNFMGKGDQQTASQGIALAKQQHDAYLVELAHVLGATIISPPTPAGPTSTPGPTETAGAATPASENSTPTPAALMMTVPGPSTVNLRRTPSLDGETMGMMKVGDSAPVLGKSADGRWLLIAIPGQASQVAWVYTSLVAVSGSTDGLTVMTPTP